MNGLKVLTLHL